MLIWISVIILLLVIIYSVSQGNSKKNTEIERLKAESEKLRSSEEQNKVHSIATELTQLKELKDKGILTEAEFDEQKAKILNR
ncbi:MAG TPA: SHOCT domain-containing protein [Bacteroidia bacterium]|nr:SHOCT domain-containing protein [Bacteroidia bacterium]